eukprot:TRINITY_DN9788_c0_g1_i1.p1 TRINITY_DN9788_c0_g1~~TRINITY_DN9788_c0_g1_i1.p1  ORF type:complete len:90 (+),score=4.35 TRINITY_DN9788_c0_g1_i1:95-364(+)
MVSLFSAGTYQGECTSDCDSLTRDCTITFVNGFPGAPVFYFMRSTTNLLWLVEFWDVQKKKNVNEFLLNREIIDVLDTYSTISPYISSD